VDIVKQLFALFLCCAVLGYAQGNTFNKVRYNGGSVASSVSAKEWGNRLTVTPEIIVLELKDNQKVEIPPRSVTSLSYGQEAHRRVGTMIALAVLVAPLALFGLLHKTRLHFIGVQYKTPENNNGGILLQGDKDNYRAMLVALQGVTGAQVAVSEKERGFVPIGVRTSVTKDAEENRNVSQNPAPPAAPEPEALLPAPLPPATAPLAGEATGTVLVETNPNGAEIYVAGQFYGNGPSTLKLAPGKHSILVKMPGYADWSRELSTGNGTDTRLIATLAKERVD